jgi:hypothetical protein
MGHNKNPINTPKTTTLARIFSEVLSETIKQPKAKALVSIDAPIA